MHLYDTSKQGKSAPTMKVIIFEKKAKFPRKFSISHNQFVSALNYVGKFSIYFEQDCKVTGNFTKRSLKCRKIDYKSEVFSTTKRRCIFLLLVPNLQNRGF